MIFQTVETWREKLVSGTAISFDSTVNISGLDK